MNTSLAAKGALAHRLQHRTSCNAALPAKSKMASRGPQNGLERCLSIGFWALLTTFSKQVFDSITSSMRKGGDREKMEKIMMFTVATNIVASRVPERQPTGMPTAHAQKWLYTKN